MIYGRKTGVILLLTTLLLNIPIISLAESSPEAVTISVTGLENYTFPDGLGDPSISVSGSVKMGFAEAIGTGAENVVIVKIYNISLSSNPDHPGMVQELNPGEDRYFSDTITAGRTSHYVRVSWDQPSSLNLTIYTPDGEYGPYHDDADGKPDQTIYLKIAASDGLDTGRWYYRINGAQEHVPVQFQIETWQE